VAGALTAVGLLLPGVLGYASGDIISRAQALRDPVFGPEGQMHFFRTSPLEMLKAGYSGFRLLESGSVLAVTFLVLYVLRPSLSRLLRWEIWAMGLSSLLLFVLAYATLFHLYLPHRYTQPLVAFFAISIAVGWQPLWTSISLSLRRPRWRLVAAVGGPIAILLMALTLFPLGPRQSLGGFLSWLADASPALVLALVFGVAFLAIGARAMRSQPNRPGASLGIISSFVLAGGVASAAGFSTPGARTCHDVELLSHLATLPKKGVVAGHPRTLNCVPIVSRRPVVMSQKLFQPWDRDYYAVIRERMFATIEGYYGESLDGILALRRRFGADYVVVEEETLQRPGGYRLTGMQPFDDVVAGLRRVVDRPALLHLPDRCMTWSDGPTKVYELACVTRLGGV
jgi:hypothetical protein